MLYATTSLFHFLGSMNYSRKDVVQLAIHYMKENLNKKIRLTDIAGEVKLSTSYFSNLFEEKTGSSPLRYLNY